MSLSKIKRTDLTFGEEIGRGGFSTVYRAKWNSSSGMSLGQRLGLRSFTQKNVAAKKTNSPEQHELEVMSRLDHENIVKLLGVVDEKPDFFLILELCDGGSLRNYLTSQGGKGKRLPARQFCDWAEQAARPIEYFRKQGIIHKDVKSDNYVIAANNVLKLTDFGLAKMIEATIDNATQRGTPGYMAPELLKEFILSPSFDVFSYGIVLWELFTTEVPFEGEDPNHVKYKMCANHVRPPIPDDCPEEIADLMRQCWQENWKRRPSIDDVLAVVRSFIFGSFPETKQLRFLLVGPTGEGRSTLGNSILGCGLLNPDQTWSELVAKPFRALSGPTAVTLESKVVTTQVLDEHISIVDTPSYLYTDMSAKEVTHEVKRGISMISPGPHVVLIVLSVGRMTDDRIECIRMLKDLLMSVDEDFAKFCIIVFTFTDEFDEDQSIHEYVEGFTGAPRQLLKDCHMRYVGFNNKLHPTSEENKEQVQRLLTMANDLVKQNDGRCFTLKDFTLKDWFRRLKTPRPR